MKLLLAFRASQTSISQAKPDDVGNWSTPLDKLCDTSLECQSKATMESPLGMRDALSSQYALNVVVNTPSASDWTIAAYYLSSVLTSASATAMIDEFDFTLTQLCDALLTPKAIPVMTARLWDLNPTQISLITTASSGPDVALPFELLHHAFETRAKARPHVRAVEIQDQWLSYGELDALANSVASDLAHLGVCVGSRVAVIMDRCLEFPIGLLAVLKVGAAMMPLDVAFPSARLAFMVADAGVCAVVTTSRFRQTIVDLELAVDVVVIAVATSKSEFVPSACHMATQLDEAYIVYTSGSTGKPKGVPVLHHSAVNSMERFGDILEIKEDSRVFQLMAIGFDGFQADMWEGLSFGATLVLRSEDDLSALSTASNLTCTPTALSLLGEPNQYPQLKVVAVAGEAFPVALKDLWAPRVKLFNLYGPSECAIMSHGTRLSLTESIAIGSVLPNVHCYVLDDNHRQVPFGILGEFYLSGICVSPGYINLPGMTEERFFEDPFGHGRMYKTGDLGRLLPNGQFEIAGRQDSQVKLKGYRIELDEVANAMMQHPSVKSAAAIVKDKTHLVGYFTPSDVDVVALEQCVNNHLPTYMVPAVWIGLDVMPMNSNGKIDKKVLVGMEVQIKTEGLESDTEVKLAAVWAQVFDVDTRDIGRRMSMFSLGGDSILAIRLASACNRAGLPLSVGDIMKYNRLCDMALRVGQQKRTAWPQVPLDDHTIDQVVTTWPDYETAYGTTPEQSYQVRMTKQDPSMWVLQVPLSGLDAHEALAAYLQLAATCETLRTTFVDSATLGVCHVVNSSASVYRVQAESMRAFLATDASVGFKLSDSSFARFTVVDIAHPSEESIGVLTIHHALYDGWSISLLLSDLLHVYRTGTSPPSRPSFRAVIDYLHAQDSAATVAFWTAYLADASTSPLLNSIVPHQYASVGSDGDGSVSTHVHLPQLQTLAQRFGVTTSTVVLLSWAMTLQVHTGRDDVVFGQVQANRNLPVEGLDRMLGCAMSSVPCRVHFGAPMTLVDRLQQLQTMRSAMLGHCMIDPEDTTTWSHLPAMQYDTEVAFHNFNDNHSDVDDLLRKMEKGSEHRFGVYKIELAVAPTASGVQIDAAFDAGRIQRAAVASMVCRMRHVLHQCQEDLVTEAR
ncbi:hypothetical protein DYB34_002538 [Aphanomyces astaci]|uniref:Carrier domain-containing protein n=1 Tax=Aphanomyces astaci TaxID=112090 RepID=A0A3R6ZV25_APHAT|nr:hypothetical protein DYB34_002538 [Aphanomyces astaci]